MKKSKADPLTNAADGWSRAKRQEVIFVLWKIFQGWTQNEFHQHFGDAIAYERDVEDLVRIGLLDISGRLVLTPKGRSLIEQLATGRIEGEGLEFDEYLSLLTDIDSNRPPKKSAHTDELFRTYLTEESDSESSHAGLALLPMANEFLGRVAELNWLMEKLVHNPPSACGVYGIPGIGKTTLAAAAVRKLKMAGYLTDGVLVIRAQNPDSIAMLRGILAQASGNGRTSHSPSFQALAAQARMTLSGKDVLVVIDDVTDIKQASSIAKVVTLLGELSVRLLIISTYDVSSMLASKNSSLRLQSLSVHEAMNLFRTLSRKSRTVSSGYFDEDIRLLVQKCGCHPLAVKLLSMQCVDLNRSPRQLASEMDTDLSVHGVWDHNTSIQLLDVFRSTISSMRAQTIELLTAFGAFKSLDLSFDAAVVLAKHLGMKSQAHEVNIVISRVLAEQYQYEAGPYIRDGRRIRLHAMVHNLAKHLLSETDPKKQEGINGCVLDYYERYVRNAVTRLSVSKSSVLIDRDHENICGVIDWALANYRDTATLRLVSDLRAFWYNRWHLDKCQKYFPQAIAAGRRLESHAPRAEVVELMANIAFTNAQLLRRAGQTLEANDALLENLMTRRQINDRFGEAAALRELGVVARINGRLEEAENYVADAIRIRQEIHDQSGECYDRTQLGRIMIWQGKIDNAERELQISLDQARTINDERTTGAALTYLGQIAHQRGELNTAEQYLGEALQITTLLQDKRGQGVVWHLLGLVARTRGNLDQAAEYIQMSYQMRVITGDKRGEGEALGHLARIAREEKRFDEASTLLQKSLDLAREVGDKRGEAIVTSGLARVEFEQGRYDAAKRLFGESVQRRAMLQDYKGIGRDSCFLGKIALFENDGEAAQRYFNESLRLSRESKDNIGIGNALFSLGMVAIRQRRVQEAHRLFYEALGHIYRAESLPQLRKLLLELGQFYIDHQINALAGSRIQSYAQTQFPRVLNQLLAPNNVPSPADVVEKISELSHLV